VCGWRAKAHAIPAYRVWRSRSEAAAFLIGAGVDAQHELFERVGERSAEIKKIRQSLKQDALKALRHVMRAGRKSKATRTKD